MHPEISGARYDRGVSCSYPHLPAPVRQSSNLSPFLRLVSRTHLSLPPAIDQQEATDLANEARTQFYQEQLTLRLADFHDLPEIFPTPRSSSAESSVCELIGVLFVK